MQLRNYADTQTVKQGRIQGGGAIGAIAPHKTNES